MAGVSSQGLTISKGNGASPEVFAEIANVTGHDGPSRENPEIDVSDLNATAKEFLPGLVDNGEISLNVNFDPAATSQTDLLTAQEARTVSNYRITWPGASPAKTWTFPAFVKSFSTTSSVDAPLTGSITLRVTGDVTRA